MKVFLSFSGSVSHEAAQLFYGWLPRVIQSLRPYMSSVDIDKGARWSSDIAVQLEDTHYGILFVTKGNVASPWLNFEAGALSKSPVVSRVSPFLFDVSTVDLINGPLTQFQATKNTREDIKQLVFTLNRGTTEPFIEGEMLNSIFDKWWDDLAQPLDALARREDRKPEDLGARHVVDTNEILMQVYEMQLSLQRRLATLEAFPRALPSVQARNRNDDQFESLVPDIELVTDVLTTSFPRLTTQMIGRAVESAFRQSHDINEAYELAKSVLSRQNSLALRSTVEPGTRKPGSYVDEPPGTWSAEPKG
jgi:hypothetical protein